MSDGKISVDVFPERSLTRLSIPEEQSPSRSPAYPATRTRDSSEETGPTWTQQAENPDEEGRHPMNPNHPKQRRGRSSTNTRTRSSRRRFHANPKPACIRLQPGLVHPSTCPGPVLSAAASQVSQGRRFPYGRWGGPNPRFCKMIKLCELP